MFLFKKIKVSILDQKGTMSHYGCMMVIPKTLYDTYLAQGDRVVQDAISTINIRQLNNISDSASATIENNDNFNGEKEGHGPGGSGLHREVSGLQGHGYSSSGSSGASVHTNVNVSKPESSKTTPGETNTIYQSAFDDTQTVTSTIPVSHLSSSPSLANAATSPINSILDMQHTFGRDQPPLQEQNALSTIAGRGNTSSIVSGREQNALSIIPGRELVSNLQAEGTSPSYTFNLPPPSGRDRLPFTSSVPISVQGLLGTSGQLQIDSSQVPSIQGRPAPLQLPGPPSQLQIDRAQIPSLQGPSGQLQIDRSQIPSIQGRPAPLQLPGPPSQLQIDRTQIPSLQGPSGQLQIDGSQVPSIQGQSAPLQLQGPPSQLQIDRTQVPSLQGRPVPLQLQGPEHQAESVNTALERREEIAKPPTWLFKRRMSPFELRTKFASRDFGIRGVRELDIPEENENTTPSREETQFKTVRNLIQERERLRSVKDRPTPKVVRRVSSPASSPVVTYPPSPREEDDSTFRQPLKGASISEQKAIERDRARREKRAITYSKDIRSNRFLAYNRNREEKSLPLTKLNVGREKVNVPSEPMELASASDEALRQQVRKERLKEYINTIKRSRANDGNRSTRSLLFEERRKQADDSRSPLRTSLESPLRYPLALPAPDRLALTHEKKSSPLNQTKYQPPLMQLNTTSRPPVHYLDPGDEIMKYELMNVLTSPGDIGMRNATPPSQRSTPMQLTPISEKSTPMRMGAPLRSSVTSSQGSAILKSQRGSPLQTSPLLRPVRQRRNPILNSPWGQLNERYRTSSSSSATVESGPDPDWKPKGERRGHKREKQNPIITKDRNKKMMIRKKK